MCLAALRTFLLACSLASAPFLAVSWEIKMSDLEEKDVDEFSSNGLKCPTCFAVREETVTQYSNGVQKDKIKCVEFHGIINTGISNIAIEMKSCIKADLCKESVTSYMDLPVANESIRCRSATTNGAKIRPSTPIFFILFLEKLFH